MSKSCVSPEPNELGVVVHARLKLADQLEPLRQSAKRLFTSGFYITTLSWDEAVAFAKHYAGVTNCEVRNEGGDDQGGFNVSGDALRDRQGVSCITRDGRKVSWRYDHIPTGMAMLAAHIKQLEERQHDSHST